jgi:ABC-type spermidine/putrescine transport system permease subunit II
VIVVVFLLSVIRIFSSFETELLLGVPWGFYVYATKIVDLARQEPPLVNQAAALGSVILVFLVLFIPIQRRLIARRQFTAVTGQFKPKIIDLGVWRYPATAFVGLVVFSLTVVPILSVFGGSFMTRFGFFNLPKTWTLDYWKMALTDPRIIQGLQNTLITACSAAIFGAFFFSLVGYVLVRTKYPGRGILDSICWLPSAIPGVLSGLGLLWMFLGTPFFRPFYGTLFLLVIAVVLGGITLSTQILKANFVQLGKELEEASRMSGAGFWRTYFKVVFPLMAQTMVLVCVLKFTFAAQNASSIILLATSETRTLSLLALLEPQTSNDTETLGLWGSVHKQLWELTKDERHLDEAVRAYERGFYLRNDYYNGINFAFLLDCRAAELGGEDAVADRVQARHIRERVVGICKQVLAEGIRGETENKKSEEEYWIRATLVEALFGLGRAAESEVEFTIAKEVAPEPWMINTTEEQLAKLRALQR